MLLPFTAENVLSANLGVLSLLDDLNVLLFNGLELVYPHIHIYYSFDILGLNNYIFKRSCESDFVL